jgi:L-arabinose isomerase
MKNIKIGLLPLYIKLYDDSNADRTFLYSFYNRVAGLLKNQGFEVIKNDFCRIKSEFKEAVEKFETEGADVIVTLHIAYSPSLESIDALCSTDLPIVVLDTTEAYGLNFNESPDPIMNNHGIHGVMDMCNLLKQRGKKYALAVGHESDGKVFKKASELIRAAVAAKSLKGSKVGLFGTSFDGMGDFLISKEDAKNIFGVDMINLSDDQMKKLTDSISDLDIEAEKEEYIKDYVSGGKIGDDLLSKAVRAALAVRKGISEMGLDAFSINFLDVSNKNLGSMPFIECCKQMQMGVGYAGEGDALTASIIGALMKGFDDVSFIEIFCPDWKKNKLMISHMGEMSYAVAKDKPVLKACDFPYSDIAHVVKSLAEYKQGKAVFGNLFKDSDGKYKFLFSNITMVEGEKGFEDSIRGWFVPDNLTIDEFLYKLSEYGAIHHSFMIYNVDIKALEYFAKLLGFEAYVI